MKRGEKVKIASIVYMYITIFPSPFGCVSLARMHTRAPAAVKSIKKEHLQEVRRLPNPPTAVKLAVESIVTLLGERELDWRAARQTLMRDNFIATIVNFDTGCIE